MSEQKSIHLEKANPTAFLSHSSVDKGFAEAVAVRLGRVQVKFDKWCFETGDEFIKAIPSALQTSDVFVLFASRASLQSFWVQLEINHAQMLLASAVLRKALVFIIDDSLDYSDLPKWMQGSLTHKFTSPNSVARVIQTRLDSLRGVKQNEYFFGRDQLIHEFSQRLFPTNDALPPNLLVIAGLSGMGRRTFAKHVLEERMSMRTGPTFHLRKGDGFDALHLALLSETSPLASKEQISAEITAFRQADLGQRTDELIRLLILASDGNVAPMILDDGALIESNGAYTDEATSLIRQLRKSPQITVVLIQSRLPNMPPSSMVSLGMCGTKVPPLDSEASRQFLNRRFADNNIAAKPDQVVSLIPALNGFPPAFNMATSYSKEYGLPTLLNNKAVLTSFQQQEFADLLTALNLTNNEWGILRLLAAGMEFPVEGLMAATGQPSTTIVPAVQHLVDLSLVLNDGGTLAVAGPVTYAIQAAKGTIRPNEYAFIGKSLKAEFWDKQDAIPDYGILEATISALLRGGDEPDLKDFKQIVVPSMLLRNAKYHYQMGGHENWLKAKNLLDSLLKLEDHNRRALSLLMKIQVRLHRWAEAEATLEEIKKFKLPEQYFLEGFLLWKRRKFGAAIPHFETALALGQGAVEIYHGLASCLFRVGQLDKAKKVIQKGLHGRARQNVLLVDLAAQIAIDKNELDEAEKYVEQLRRLKADADYHHRAATLLNARHKSREALQHARKATQGPGARFEAKTTFVNALIEVHQFAEAGQQLDLLDETYKFEVDRRDILLGLRCKYLLRQGMWSQAEPLWEALEDKGSAVHAALRKEILQQKIADKKTSIAERNEATLELVSFGAAPSLESLPISNLIGADEAVAVGDEDEN
jgi:tetratricopeptide (TPR) repeat protein